MRHIIARSIVLSSLLLPVAAFASNPSDEPAASTPAPRVSTGVIGPTLLSTIYLSLPEGLPLSLVPFESQVGVSFVVNAKGVPENIQVTKSVNPVLDSKVVDAVSKLHYRPGTIDDQKVAVPMNLTVVINK